MMKKRIESPFRKLKILVVLPLVAMLFYAFAAPEYQYGNENNSVAPEGKTMDVKGQVLKSDGNPLHGTSVILRGSTMGTITDQDGNFLLKGIPTDGELVFSFVGFKTVVQKVGSQPMKIVMEVSKVGIDQITVIGYGTPPPPPPPPAMSLRGIDDANPPLIFLDGIPITKAALDKINPETIESISVLKNKSATDVYGERAKNGAILITSKEKAGKSTGTPPPPPPPLPPQYGNKNSSVAPEGKKVDVKGQVMKSDGNPLPGTSVVLRGSTLGTITDQDGNFLLKGISADGELVFSFVGYQPKVQKVGDMPMKIVMEVSKVGLDQVNVVGNGTPSSLPLPLYSIIMERGLDNANPPLIFLDGIPITKDAVDKIKPGTIESVSVLKDKSATAVYGEKGKNGVILIKTKSDTGRISGQVNVVQKSSDNVFVVVEEMPEFPGGEMALRSFIVRTIKYPADAIKDSIQGKVFVTFVVKSDGTVGDAKIARGVHPLLDSEAIRVINSLPAWTPGKQGGEAVSVSYTVPVQFVLKNGTVKQTVSFVPPKDTHKAEKQVFVVVEEMPEFPGGALALRTFVAKAIQYPAEAQKDKIQGKVFVSFVVNSQGKVEQPKIERSVNPALDAEAIRVVSSLPDWKPGKQRGTAVSVAYTIPIEFKLQ